MKQPSTSTTLTISAPVLAIACATYGKKHECHREKLRLTKAHPTYHMCSTMQLCKVWAEVFVPCACARQLALYSSKAPCNYHLHRQTATLTNQHIGSAHDKYELVVLPALKVAIVKDLFDAL